MKNLGKLISGELDRANKYKVLTIGVGVSLIWFVVIAMLPSSSLGMLIPLLILTDSAVMSVILMSASLFFERQEGTLKTLSVTPSTVFEILVSKIFMSVVIALLSTAIVVISVLIFHGMLINVLLLIPYVILITVLHSILGIAITLISRDFNSMLINFAGFVIVLDIPAILSLLGAMPEWTELFFLFIPSQAAQILLSSTITSTEPYKVLLSIGFIILWTIFLFFGAVYSKFKEYMVKG